MSEVAAAPTSTPSTPSTPAAPSAAPSTPTTSASPAGEAKPGTVSNALPHQEGGAPAAGNDHPEAKAGETKAETVQRLKLKLKVNGREEEKDYSLEEIQLLAQKGLGAGEKFNEAATIRKQFQTFLNEFKKDPFAAMKDPELAKHFGDIDLLKMAGERIYQDIMAEEAKKADPVKFEMEQLKKKVEAFENEKKAAQEAAQKRAEAEHYEKLRQETEKSWTSELEKAGLGGNRAFIMQMAEIGREFLDNGLDLNPAHLVTELKNRIAEQKRVVMGGLKGKELLGFLGDDVVNEILNYKLEELKAGKVVQEPIKAPEPTPVAEEKPAKAPRPIHSLRQFRDFMSEE